jgi:hypothetical protein
MVEVVVGVSSGRGKPSLYFEVVAFTFYEIQKTGIRTRNSKNTSRVRNLHLRFCG